MVGAFGSCSRRAGAIGLLSCLAFLLISLGSAIAAPPDDPFPLERLFSFGPNGNEATDFERIDSIAMDQGDGYAYILAGEENSTGTLFKFGPDGEPVDFGGSSAYIDGNRINELSPFEKNPFVTNQVAVSPVSKVIYVAEADAIRSFEADGEPGEFTAGPGTGTSEIPGFTELTSVAIDNAGNIYANDLAGTVSIFSSTGAPLTSFPVTNPFNVRVGADGRVYVQKGQEVIERFTPSSLPISGSTTYAGVPFASVPGGSNIQIAGFDVDPVNGDVYVLESTLQKTWLRRYDESGVLVESFGAPGTASESESFGGVSESIAVWGEENEIAEGERVKVYIGDRNVSVNPKFSKVAALGSKIVIGPPAIENTSVLDVTADSARLRAWVDPNTAETTYRFEYGLEDCAVSACTSVPLGGASVGDGEQPVEVANSIFGLQPDTTYHYRVLAESSLGMTVVPVSTFTTQPLGIGFELIDSRVWEMVSPSDQRGAELLGLREGLIQAASDGEGLAYVTLGSLEPDPKGNRAPEISTVLARRSPAGYWASKDIASPNDESTPLAVGGKGEFKFFSPDLSKGILVPRSGTPLSPQASERTPYLREHGDPPVYTPLLTGKEGFANVPPETEFGGSLDDALGPVTPVGATPNFTSIVLRSRVSTPLVAGLTVPPFPHTVLYLWRGGQLRPVSLLPGDEGGGMAIQPVLGSNETTLQHAISADGSRVFWGRLAQVSGGALYMRDTLAEETVRLDVVQPGAAGTGGATPVFQGASADGTVVFFTDSRQLTADSSPTGRDLYRCEIPAGPTMGCTDLIDLTAPLAGSGDSSEVLGTVPGLGEDGGRIYFVAEGVLDDLPNPRGDSAMVGEPNLYLWEEGEGVQFVATLAEADKGTWGLRGTTVSFGEAAKLAASVSPSGRYLVFMSQRSLSGYSNLEATSGKPVQEIFRYDSVSQDLDCLSCNPFGAAPQGEDAGGRALINPVGAYTDLGMAAALPGGYSSGTLPFYRPRVALDNGRVFFNAFDSLVPSDSNGEWDVYQWEPTGVGGCSISSGDAATAHSAGGCVSLLSSGTAEKVAAFLDASVSGDDAFFLTPARLSAIDEDNELDVYDARVGGIVATRQPRPECQGEACRAVGPPPSDSVPGSATFLGPGNAKPSSGKKPCPKGKRKMRVKGKVRCVPRKRSHRHRKASQNRRASR